MGLEPQPPGPSALTGGDATTEWAVSWRPGRRPVRRATVDPRHAGGSIAASIRSGLAMAVRAAAARDLDAGPLLGLAATLFPDLGRVPETEAFGVWVGADHRSVRLYGRLDAEGASAFGPPVPIAVVDGLTEARFAAVKVGPGDVVERCAYVRPVPGGSHRAIGLLAARCGFDGGRVIEVLERGRLGPALWAGDVTVAVAIGPAGATRLTVHLSVGGRGDPAAARRRVGEVVGRLAAGATVGVSELFADLDAGGPWWPSAVGVGFAPGPEIERLNVYAAAHGVAPAPYDPRMDTGRQRP